MNQRASVSGSNRGKWVVRNAEHDGKHRLKFRDSRAAFTPNPAKPEPITSPGNPNLETRNPKQLMKNQNSRKRK
jgi:hypothetical protein